ncbi:MAG: ChbG/HpnK family deacetylase [Deltaproteobacteria bacterium]|nr:ChbG/HpnK family deacetylase [Deltaproteobacteria bacterium]
MGAAIKSEARRRVIITGDDFGLAPAVNAAIIRAHREGILTCASLMVNAPAWQEAVELAQAWPELCVGLHLTLIQGRGVLSHRHIPHLVDDQGNFRRDPVAAGLMYYFSRRARQEIRDELEAQMEKMLAAGLHPQFLNGHLNIHLHPAIWPLVKQSAEKYAIPAVRLAWENLGATLSLNPRRPIYKTGHALIFACLSAQAAKNLGGLRTNRHLFGLLNDGWLDESYLLGVLPQLQHGVTEIYFHPAVQPGPEAKYWPRHYRPQAELAALTSPKVAQRLAELKIDLISFRDL